MPFTSFTTLAAFLWLHSRAFTSFLNCRTPNCSQLLRCSLTSAEYSRIITSSTSCWCWVGCTPGWGLTSGLPGHTLLAPTEPAVDQHLQVPLCGAAFQPLLSQFLLVPSTALSQMQNPVFGLNFMLALHDSRDKPWTPTFYHSFPRNPPTHNCSQ